MPGSIPLALLAEYAIAHSDDNRLSIVGGGIRSLYYPSFPATQQRLALVLGLEFPAASSPEVHRMRIQAQGPTDEVPVKPVIATLTVMPVGDDQPGYVHFVYNMEQLRFAAPGLYRFVVLIDDAPACEVPLRVLAMPGPREEAGTRLNEGYAAFASGKVEEAKGIFEGLVEQFPDFAAGHNNLGFVLLSMGDGQRALEAFDHARALGYSQPEILDANIGCAHYVRGDPVSASIFFDQCLRVHGYRGGALLYGIASEGLFPVDVKSASDYVGLMMLNRAWSSFRSGDRSGALLHLGGARAGELSHRDEESGKSFSQSVAALEQRLT